MDTVHAVLIKVLPGYENIFASHSRYEIVNTIIQFNVK